MGQFDQYSETNVVHSLVLYEWTADLDMPGMRDLFERIAALFAAIDAPRAFCHSDLVPQNFIVGDRLRALRS